MTNIRGCLFPFVVIKRAQQAAKHADGEGFDFGTMVSNAHSWSGISPVGNPAMARLRSDNRIAIGFGDDRPVRKRRKQAEYHRSSQNCHVVTCVTFNLDERVVYLVHCREYTNS
jgi:hypothetical protein